ncbi:MAG: hypothetical protein PHH40_03245 [Candidatus Moranbacteria bacterium]|nr:hypothetical protein [Candidatus Moranbacteria bacterium]MDD3964736.1 hypothetical protein [Candidatus Moranbacteria bacterium]
MSWKSIVVGVFLFLLGGALGSTLVTLRTDTSKNISPSDIGTNSPAYQAGFDAAKKMIDESGVNVFFQSQNEKKELSGTVTAIDGDRITFHDNSIKNPFDTAVQRDFTVRTDANTLFIKMTPKDNKVLQELLEQASSMPENVSVSQEASSVPTMSLYDSVMINKNEIKVESMISVVLAEEGNDGMTVLAKEVRVRDSIMPAINQ